MCRDPYYKEITENFVDSLTNSIDLTLKEAFKAKQISYNDNDAMITTGKTPGMFYELFKVHKNHEPSDLPWEDQY